MFATTINVRCFEYENIGHKRFACPHMRTGAVSVAGSSVEASDNVKDSAEATRDDVVPPVEVSVVNADAVLSADDETEISSLILQFLIVFVLMHMLQLMWHPVLV